MQLSVCSLYYLMLNCNKWVGLIDILVQCRDHIKRIFMINKYLLAIDITIIMAEKYKQLTRSSFLIHHNCTTRNRIFGETFQSSPFWFESAYFLEFWCFMFLTIDFRYNRKFWFFYVEYINYYPTHNMYLCCALLFQLSRISLRS